jgi:hypothetical protein
VVSLSAQHKNRLRPFYDVALGVLSDVVLRREVEPAERAHAQNTGSQRMDDPSLTHHQLRRTTASQSSFGLSGGIPSEAGAPPLTDVTLPFFIAPPLRGSYHSTVN